MSGGTFDAILTSGMASIKGAADAAGRSVGKMTQGLTRLGDTGTKEFGRIGQAVAKMGGPGGELGGKFFGAMGLEGGIGKLAITAVAAGVAFRAFSGALDMARQRAQAFASTLAGLRAAMRSAAEARRSMAAGAVDTGRTQAKAENLWGKHAGGEAKFMGDEYGVDAEDVLGGMAGSAGIPEKMRRRAMQMALTAARSGELSVTEAMRMLSDPAVRAIVLGQQAGGGLDATTKGAAQLVMRARGAHGPDALREATNAVGGFAQSPGTAREQLGDINRAGNVAFEGRTRAVASGATGQAIRERNANEVPGRKEFDEWLRAQNAAVQQLEDASRKAGKWVEWWADKWSLNGTIGPGSFATQAGDANQNKIDAIRGMSGEK
jgi:hypothetical protein